MSDNIYHQTFTDKYFEEARSDVSWMKINRYLTTLAEKLGKYFVVLDQSVVLASKLVELEKESTKK